MSEAIYTLPDAPEVALPAEDGEGTYVHNAAHAAQMQSQLIEFFRKPRNLEMMRIVGTYIQEAEDAVLQLYTGFDVDTAVGVQLDMLGAVVGERRDGRDDDDFRAAVRVRILVNSSDGKIDQMIAIALGMVPTATVGVAEYYPAALSMVLSEQGGASLATIFAMLRQAKPAGVRLELTVGPGTIGAEDDDPLGGTIGAEDDDPLGFTIAGGT